MTIYYENTEREIFDMSDFPVAIEDITPLYGRKWKYDASDDKTRNRSSIEMYYIMDVEYMFQRQNLVDWLKK